MTNMKNPASLSDLCDFGAAAARTQMSKPAKCLDSRTIWKQLIAVSSDSRSCKLTGGVSKMHISNFSKKVSDARSAGAMLQTL